MNRTDLEHKLADLQVWKRGSERAPHKPLLILYALARFARGEGRLVSYEEVHEHLAALLSEFGPPRQSIHTEYPFWRLQNDGIWEVQATQPMELRKGHTDPKKSQLLLHRAKGGFVPEVAAVLASDPSSIYTLAHIVLDANFPPSIHEDILEAVGLDERGLRPHRKRDVRFRLSVLVAYEHRCGICGLDIRMGTTQLCLDAAHIKWHQAGGPDSVQNGLALCVLHHKLFDRGAVTITHEYVTTVSELLHGSKGLEEHMLAYNGKRILGPQRPDYLPSAEFIDWHHREVFQGPRRYVQ